MKFTRYAGYNVFGGSNCKYTKMNGITEIKYISNSNKEISTRKLNKDEYVLLNTGEVFEYRHSENRSENLQGIRQSIAVLRKLINNNFTGGKNELWITLTFGENKIYNPKELCEVFEKFMKRLRYSLKPLKLDYLYVPEPHEKGDWHIHVLLKSDKTLYIKNSELNEIWGNGFVKVNRLKDVDNIGAYVSAYLINIKEGENTKKGARLYLYPAQHKLYRCSRGIKKPVTEEMEYNDAMKLIKGHHKTFESTVKIENEQGFSSYIHYEYYNEKRKED